MKQGRGSTDRSASRRVVALIVCVLVSCAQAQESTPVPESSPGPSPGLFEVDEEAAVRALESSLIRANALLLRPWEVEIGIATGYRSDSSTQSFLANSVDEDGNATPILGQQRDSAQRLISQLSLQVGLMQDLQFGLALPYGRLDRRTDVTLADLSFEDGGEDARGVGDLRISLLKTLLRESGARPDLLGSLIVDTSTGSAAGELAGVSSGANEFAFALTATKRQDPFVFTAGLAHTIVDVNGGIDSERQSTALSLAAYLAASPYTSLRLGVDLASAGAPDADGTYRKNRSNPAALSFGVSSVIGRVNSVSLNVDVGLTEQSEDYGLSLDWTRRLTF